MLVMSLIFIASLSQDLKVVGQTSLPTPIQTSILALNQTQEPVATPELTHSQTNFTKFAYSAIGKYCSNTPIAETITLCNYTTPPYSGKIMQISIYLKGTSEASNARAVIFANEPNVNFPQGGEPIAQSFETFNVGSVAGQWYNFTMNYSASPNTVYWLGYYSDNLTYYFFDESNSSITVTSQPKDGASSWLPVGWSYQGKTTMSLYALFTYVNPSPTATTTQLNSPVNQPTQSYWDVVFVLLIIGGETAIVLSAQAQKNEIMSKTARKRFNFSLTQPNAVRDRMARAREKKSHSRNRQKSEMSILQNNCNELTPQILSDQTLKKSILNKTPLKKLCQKRTLLVLLIINASLILYALGIATDFFASPMFSVFFILSYNTAHEVAYGTAITVVAVSVAILTLYFRKTEKIQIARAINQAQAKLTVYAFKPIIRKIQRFITRRTV